MKTKLEIAQEAARGGQMKASEKMVKWLESKLALDDGEVLSPMGGDIGEVDAKYLTTLQGCLDQARLLLAIERSEEQAERARAAAERAGMEVVDAEVK